jgi:hypothetical protein
MANRTYLQAAACALLFTLSPLHAFEAVQLGGLSIKPSFKTILALQYGEGINYGHGAIDSPGETERSTAYLVAKPKVDLNLPLDDYALVGKSSLYGALSVVAATTQLDGEISGQTARAGDWAVSTDHAYLGWRNDLVDLSVGGQEFSVGDGFIVGDGNYNKGGENGQYWSGGFLAWRNSAILKINTSPLRADLFWLRTDTDFKDARVAGINVETTTADTFGTVGAMYLEVLQGGAFNYDGMKVWNLRGAGIKVPGVPALKLYGEWVLERGHDLQGGGAPNDATAWYVEGEFTVPGLPWLTRLNYRYSWMQGDNPRSRANEEYRGLFYTIFRRDWDTWYQGEIAGEYHLYNENQITQMLKLKTFPLRDWSLTFYYYHHQLEQPHYFALQLTETNWADELNFGVEHFVGDRFFGYAGLAWSTPNAAAREVYGDKNFWVIQTYLSYTF